ncbi:MAG: hypothetical protein AB7O28_02025 [Vicinamibacterales bacterium]
MPRARPLHVRASRPRGRRWRRIALALLSLPVIALTASSAVAKARTSGRQASVRRLQGLADAIRARLGIDRDVTVAIVPKNPYFVSVEAPTAPGGAFVLRVEDRWRRRLAADEMEAALAHELGHVWIFTHHPYLQTELLANQVAMRVVSRDALVRVYDKVWADGVKGDLTSFLGEADGQ